MLGWEFPPHISGGLGTACHGIVNGLGKIPDTKVIFVVPKVFGDEKATNAVFAGANKYLEHHSTIQNRRVRILVPDAEDVDGCADPSAPPARKTVTTFRESTERLIYVETASMLHPYMQAEQIERILIRKHIDPETVYFDECGRMMTTKGGRRHEVRLSFSDLQTLDDVPERFEFTGKYTSNLYTETGMFARVCERLAQQYDFDVIHAHDWLTYEAGIAIKKATGKPLVIHVHATEYDRSGGTVNPRVADIERHGIREADAIITVSNLTRDICVDKYGADIGRITTVYNAVDFRPQRHEARKPDGEKIVTFLGRITFQKGPEYFLEAAYKVLQRVRNVRFVMAGNGDMYYRMIREAARLRIADRFHFTDFLNRDEVRHLFSISDVFVMPSVSEPFGIVPLEALKSGVPVIISNQSGVSEVLRHALKVDYWDVDSMADAIYALVKYPALNRFFVKHGRNEVDQMKWDGCAANIYKVYEKVVSR